jgi:Heavy metal binding domain
MRITPSQRVWIRSDLSLIEPRQNNRAFARVWMALVALLFCSFDHPGICDVPVPENMLNPASPAEAWNVIGLATRNVEKLVEESRLPEIPQQISLCSPALRTLARVAGGSPHAEAISKETSQLQGWVIAVARAAVEGNRTATESGFRMLKNLFTELGRHYDAATVKADIFICPMHPDCISSKASADCGKCGMALVIRRIPYSFIYTTPEEPTVVLSVTASGPCEAGKRIDVKVRMLRKAKSPVLVSDLMVMHTEPIHLLIEEPSLSDYHHEHPVPTSTPGEYAFSFIPARTTSYRIWADIVPTATGIQELPYVDLPSRGEPAPPQDTTNRFSSTVEGYQFALNFAGGNHIPVQAGKTKKMSITVTNANGQPVTTLEPVMNAFAHLVGFYDDYKTVVHLHPSGGDILNPELRGGPSLGFQFFPPKSGFIRLYCQVSIGKKMLFAPFNLNVTP